MNRKAQTFATATLFVTLMCAPAHAQEPQHVILNVDVQNLVQYLEDVPDISTFASKTAVTPGVAARNFQQSVIIGDIVAVNGQPAKGINVHHLRSINLRTAPTPGQAISDLMRGNIQSLSFEFLSDDGTPIGTIHCAGLGGPGNPPPGAPLSVSQGNNAIVGGTGVFLGARGQQGQAVTQQSVANRQASMTEDPANRRTNGGGTSRFVLDVIPLFVPQIVTTAAGPSIFHSADFSPVTATKPAKVGEVLIAMATGFGPTKPGVDPGQPFPAFPDGPLQAIIAPVGATVNGRPASVVHNAIGWPGLRNTYRVDFDVPAGTAPGIASVQLSSAWIVGPAVDIPIQ